MWNNLGYGSLNGQDINASFNLWRVVTLVWAVTVLLMGVISFACAQEGEIDWPYELGVGSAGIFYAGLGFFGIVALLSKRSRTVQTYYSGVVVVMTAITIYYLYKTIVHDHKLLRPLLSTLGMAGVCALWTICNHTYLKVLKRKEQMASDDVETPNHQEMNTVRPISVVLSPAAQPPHHPVLPAHIQNAPTGYPQGNLSSPYPTGLQQQPQDYRFDHNPFNGRSNTSQVD
ncbi:hypothetical protein PROFUN_13336 [Planoprotostelium fungivorum]|uniref:Uncharacterized protein n=1 Tax=Planoprotostelium fungivorum TaxID=1890364 RepID=A0A2P6N4L8_9EUKA|nr:hypothetical protein PROFUN_13336 [Planoprotostelium fungivorum]